MKIHPDKLFLPDFVMLQKIEHNALIPFIQTYLRKKTYSSLFYILANLIIFLSSVVTIFFYVRSGDISIPDSLSHFAYGIALSFLLIPLHEYIHVLAYKMLGAKYTSYDVNLKKFYFLAIADRFVANRSEFTIVALAPFVIITLGTSIMICLTPLLWKLIFFGELFTHTACCSGDFGFLSYFEYHKKK